MSSIYIHHRQSARLQLRFSAGAAAPAPISVPIVPVDEPIPTSLEDTAMEVEIAQEEVISAPEPKSPAKPVTPVDMMPRSTATASSIHISVAASSSPAPTPFNLPSPAATVSAILSDNFDRVSIPAVLTLARYLLNILLNPSEDKFRRISTENKAFQSKIATAKGAVTFLCSVGFVHPPYNNAVLVLHSSSASTSADVKNDGGEGSVLSAAQQALLQEGYAQLLRAMKELEVPVEERPYQGADWSTIKKQLEAQCRESELRSASQVAAFDPYKTHIVRTAPQVRH